MDAETGYNNWRDMEGLCLCESRELKQEMGHGPCAIARYDIIVAVMFCIFMIFTYWQL